MNNNEETHDPEQPSLHRGQRHPESDVLDDVHEENDGDPEGRVEIAEDKSKRSEEGLHRQEGQVDDQMVSPETPCRPIEACHEVNDDVVDEHPGCRKGNVCEHVGDWIGCPSVHAITCLSHTH